MMDSERRRLVQAISTAIAAQKSEQEILQKAIELIDAFSADFNWTGFYMMRNGVLEVGPYIGPKTEHTRIELNSGICGAAATQQKSVIVDDVKADPRFLACSLTTRSEIVVPLMDGQTCLGEIDIDSDKPSYFTDDDRRMLEEIAAVVVERLKQVR
ncbi:MAG: GAF domain-containing protein [candidate division Zixibacteria bacterium]|nr:GAF domain-containing protein [candidate division Zixibacteria bacterium]